MRRDSKNPYYTDSGEPLLRMSVVAFIDILGFQDQLFRALQDGSSIELLRALRKALDETYKALEDNSEIVLPRLATRPHWAVKCFTDNIVIGYPIRDDGESELGTTISNLAFFQLMMILHGFFIRGGVSIGEIYIDNEIVFGEGLLESIETERNLARDPRIVISESASKYLYKHISYYRKAEESPQINQMLIDRDGQLFVNYLYPIVEFEPDYSVGEEELIKHKRIVESKMIEFRAEPTIWNKYFWVATYHNWFCDQYRRLFGEEYKINVAGINIAPSRIQDKPK